MAARLPRVSVARRAAEVLRADLRAGRWTAEQRLPSEAALSAELGVGRSSVREAVQALVRDGLLEVRHGTGTFVVPGSPARAGSALTVPQLLRRARILEVYEVRRALEAEAARLAALRAGPEDLARLDGLLHRREDLVGHGTLPFVDADLAFHRGVVDLAGNRLLSDLFEQFHEPLRDALADLVDHEPSLPDTSGAHAALLAALRAHDPDAAVRATTEHFDGTIEALRAREQLCGPGPAQPHTYAERPNLGRADP